MILILWGTLFVISIIFLIIGYTLQDTSISDVLIPTCWIFLFMLSMGMTFDKLEIPTGQIETTSYTYETIGNNSYINSTSKTVENIYTPYTHELGFWKILGSQTFGFFLAMLAASGFIIHWIEFKSRGEM